MENEIQQPVRHDGETDESFNNRCCDYEDAIRQSFSSKPERTVFRKVGGVITTEKVTQSQLDAEAAALKLEQETKAEAWRVQNELSVQNKRIEAEKSRIQREKALQEQQQQDDVLKRLSDCEKRITQLEKKKSIFKNILGGKNN